jgi:hypothetical protein
MGNSLSRIYCLILRLLLRPLMGLTGGKGGGRFSHLLPPGQLFVLQTYCKNLAFQVDTTYPMEGAIWLSGSYDIRTTRFLETMLHEAA